MSRVMRETRTISGRNLLREYNELRAVGWTRVSSGEGQMVMEAPEPGAPLPEPLEVVVNVPVVPEAPVADDGPGKCVDCGAQCYLDGSLAVLCPKCDGPEVAPVVDVIVEDGGSIFRFTPMTDTAKAWIDENVQAESWQWFGRSLCVEHRMAGDLAAGMIADGLVVE